jgi:hypothetical protein
MMAGVGCVQILFGFADLEPGTLNSYDYAHSYALAPNQPTLSNAPLQTSF